MLDFEDSMKKGMKMISLIICIAHMLKYILDILV